MRIGEVREWDGGDGDVEEWGDWRRHLVERRWVLERRLTGQSGRLDARRQCVEVSRKHPSRTSIGYERTQRRHLRLDRPVALGEGGQVRVQDVHGNAVGGRERDVLYCPPQVEEPCAAAVGADGR